MALVKSQNGSTAIDDIFSKCLNGDVVIHVVQFLDKPGKLALALTNKYFSEIVKRGSTQEVLSAQNMCDASDDVRPMVLLRDWIPPGYQLFCCGKWLQYKKGRAAERAQVDEDWHVFWTPHGVSWGSRIASKEVCDYCILRDLNNWREGVLGTHDGR